MDCNATFLSWLRCIESSCIFVALHFIAFHWVAFRCITSQDAGSRSLCAISLGEVTQTRLERQYSGVKIHSCELPLSREHLFSLIQLSCCFTKQGTKLCTSASVRAACLFVQLKKNRAQRASFFANSHMISFIFYFLLFCVFACFVCFFFWKLMLISCIRDTTKRAAGTKDFSSLTFTQPRVQCSLGLQPAAMLYAAERLKGPFLGSSLTFPLFSLIHFFSWMW